MQTYSIAEVFRSFQGEGFNTGKSAIFIRFAGCNLWSGNIGDRVSSKTCGKWCDTDFKIKHKLTSQQLISEIEILGQTQLIVLTGGEPLLQVDQELINELNSTFSALVCIETNGTIAKQLTDCWVTLSPKENSKLTLFSCSELKLVYPQQIDIPNLLSTVHTDIHYLQPKDNLESLAECIPILQKHTIFKLSLQVHKLLGAR